MSHANEITNEERIERLNATLYLVSCVPAGLLDQDTLTHCIGGLCKKSVWHLERGHYCGIGHQCLDISFSEFHGITREEAKDVVYGSRAHGEAARRFVTRQLKGLIRKYGGKVMYSYE